AICTEVSAIAMQGRGPGINPPRANTATINNGTAKARILKRNMATLARRQPRKTPGLWLAKCKQNSLPASLPSPGGGGSAHMEQSDMWDGVGWSLHTGTGR